MLVIPAPVRHRRLRPAAILDPVLLAVKNKLMEEEMHINFHAYVVTKEIGDVIFDCYESDEWTQRLLKLGKFDNGVSMEFTAEELADMEAKGDLTRHEQEIVWQLQGIIEANYGKPAYLEYF